MHPTHPLPSAPRPAPPLCPPPRLPGPTQFGIEDLEPEGTSLWFAGKQMLADKLLRDSVGRHEKTKAVVKLQKKGQGAPAREPVSVMGHMHPRP